MGLTIRSDALTREVRGEIGFSPTLLARQAAGVSGATLTAAKAGPPISAMSLRRIVAALAAAPPLDGSMTCFSTEEAQRGPASIVSSASYPSPAPSSPTATGHAPPAPGRTITSRPSRPPGRPRGRRVRSALRSSGIPAPADFPRMSRPEGSSGRRSHDLQKELLCRYFSATERRWNRTIQAWGCHASPVLKICRLV